jgi:hypothetical protein
MGLLCLNNIRSTKIKTDRLFLNKFEYCFRFRVNEVSTLRIRQGRMPSRDAVKTTLDFREKWRQQWREQLKNNGKHYSWADDLQDPAITKNDEDRLYKLLDYFHSYKKEFKYSVSSNLIYLYSNEYSMLTELIDLIELDSVNVRQAVISRPKDTIAQKNPKYQYRTYFKDISITGEIKDALRVQLGNLKDINVSRSLSAFLNSNKHYYTQRYFFVDYNDDKWLLMLHIVCPGIVRKTMSIVSAK